MTLRLFATLLLVLLTDGMRSAHAQGGPPYRAATMPAAATVASVTIPSTPTASELGKLAIFPESLSAVNGTGSDAERTTLASALNSFLQRSNAEDFSALESYLDSNGSSS